MNGYELIMKIQQKMQDPVFAAKFNKLVKDLNSIPGLQQEVMRIVKIDDPKKRQKAIDQLPNGVRNSVEEMMKLLSER
jgi:hypothetical protein